MYPDSLKIIDFNFSDRDVKCFEINEKMYMIKFGELTNVFWRVDQHLASWLFGDLECGELVFGQYFF